MNTHWLHHTTTRARLNADVLFAGNKLGNKELKAIYQLLNYESPDFKRTPGVFRPCVLLYLILASEPDRLEHYLRMYSRYGNKPLWIWRKWLAGYHAGCDCSSCYGACLQLAEKHQVIRD